MEKVAFALDMDDDWPPVATEHVWCDRAGTLYELGNVPFFIKGLALGDRFSAAPDPANGCIFEFSLVEASGHSLAWIIEPDGLALEPYKEEMFSLGLRIEGFSRVSRALPEGRNRVQLSGWGNAAEAKVLIQQSMQRFDSAGKGR